jgi:hypothetical protein
MSKPFKPQSKAFLGIGPYSIILINHKNAAVCTFIGKCSTTRRLLEPWFVNKMETYLSLD